MATSPATAPAAAPTTLGLPEIHQLMKHPRQRRRRGCGVRHGEGVRPRSAGGARAAGVEAEPAEPEDAAPSTIIVMSCGSIGSSLKPLRRPKQNAAASAAAPALTWIAVPPAKSTALHVARDPAVDANTQCATGA